MRILQSFIITTMMFIFSSCGFFLLPPLEVVNCEIKDKVEIQFSAEPSVLSVKRAFSLTEDGSAVTGEFLFSGNTVYFTPINGIQKFCDYSLIISKDAEDLKGNSLLNDFLYTYSTRTESIYPVIVSCSPKDEVEVDTDIGEVVITFSEPVDIASFHSAFQISPSFTYFTEFSVNDTVVEIIATEPIKKALRYTIKISTELMDTNRNYLQNEFVSSFMYGTDKVPPTATLGWVSGTSIGTMIPNATTDKLPPDAVFGLRFSEEVLIDTIGSYISIIPSIGLRVTPNSIDKDHVEFELTSEPQWGSEYVLTIEKGIQDVYGNNTITNSEYTLKFDDEEHRPVTFLKGYFKNPPAGTHFNEIHESTIFEPITFAAPDFAPDVDVETVLYCAFSVSNDSNGINLMSIMDNFSVSASNSCVDIVSKSMKVLDQVEYEASEIYAIANMDSDITGAEGKLSFVKITVEVTNKTSQGILSFNWGKDIKDGLGNTMISDIAYSYNKN